MGHFLGAFVDEEEHDFAVAVIFQDAFEHLFHDDGLTRAGRGDDEGALAAAEGSEEVDQAAGRGAAGVLESEGFVRRDGIHVLDAAAALPFVGAHAVDGADEAQAGGLRVVLGFAFDKGAVFDVETADELLRDVNVIGKLPEAGVHATQIAVAGAVFLEDSRDVKFVSLVRHFRF